MNERLHAHPSDTSNHPSWPVVIFCDKNGFQIAYDQLTKIWNDGKLANIQTHKTSTPENFGPPCVTLICPQHVLNGVEEGTCSENSYDSPL